MRIVFLDIDGVLNSDAWDNKRQTTSNDFLKDQFDPEAINLLNELLERIDAQIVLASTWRLNFDLEQMNELFSSIGIKRGIVSFTPNLNAGAGYLTRGNEVLKWIIDNKNIIKSKPLSYSDYIILDDKADYLISQTNNFFQTDKTVGLTPQVVQRIINNFHCGSTT